MKTTALDKLAISFDEVMQLFRSTRAYKLFHLKNDIDNEMKSTARLARIKNPLCIGQVSERYVKSVVEDCHHVPACQAWHRLLDTSTIYGVGDER